MKAAHEVISEILVDIAQFIKVGGTDPKDHPLTGHDIATRIETRIALSGCTSYNKGYHPKWARQPYPSVCCININHMIAHGVPSDYVFQQGDIVSVDLGIKDKDGQCADAAFTMGIGEISNEKQRLLRHARGCVYEGIKQVKNGASTRDVTVAMERYAIYRGFKINRSFGGHGIGKEMHEDPHIFNVDDPKNVYTTLKTGMVICLEPMLTTGNDDVGLMMPDGWTIFTRDGKPSAVFEHMIRVTDDGAEVLTTHFDNSLE